MRKTPTENTKGKEIYEETSINGKKQNAKGVKRKKSKACRSKASDGSGLGDVGPSVKVSGPKAIIDRPRGTTTEAVEDGYVSDTSASLVGSDSDAEDRPQYPKYRKGPISEISFEKGMLFASKQEFKDAIKDYAVGKGFNVRLVKDDCIRVRVKCKHKCPFVIYCAKRKSVDTWQIRTYNDEHICGRQFRNKQASSKWLGKNIVEQLRTNRNMKLKDVTAHVYSTFNIHINKRQAQRAKLRASEVLEGTYKEQYAQLGDYCELYKTNPGSTAVLSVNRPHPELQPYFERFYVCLDACKRGFLSACRPFIGVDGCHLKGEFTRQLLTAVGKDGNNGIYPIAFAVVEAKTKESWTWFLSRLHEDIGGVNERRWNFMSD